VVIAAGLSLAFEGGFRGCGSDSSPPPGTLPPGEPLECVSDSDCPAPMCRDAVCVAGRCEVRDVMIDRDGDGFTGAPCGMDCDDSDSAIYPGSFESCDDTDNDCDSIIDEGAPPTVQVYEVAASIQAATARADLPGVLLFSTTPVGAAFELEARWLDLGPTAPFAIETVAPLSADDAIVVALPTATGARVLWASVTERTVRETTVDVEHTGSSVTLTVGSPTTVLEMVDVNAMRAVETASGYALLLDETDPMTMERSRVLFIPGSPRVVLPYRDGPFDIAVRDTRFYTPSEDAALAVLDAAGNEVNRVPVPGTFAGDAVVTWNGRLFLTAADFSDYTVRELSGADMIGDGWPLTSSGPGGPDLAMHPLARTLGITRASSSGLELMTYDETGAMVEYQWAVIDAGSSGTFRQHTLLDTSVGLAAVATRGDPLSSAVAAVACRATP